MTLSYDIFRNVCLDVITKYTSLKTYIRANLTEYMDKELNQALRTPERLVPWETDWHLKSKVIFVLLYQGRRKQIILITST